MFLASLWYLLFLFIGSVKSDLIMQRLIKAFAESHPVQCHILLFTHSNEFSERRILLDFYRAVIRNNHVPTVLENIDTESKKIVGVSSAKRCNKSLQSFVIGNVTHIAKYMIAEKGKRNILEDVWLLFLRDDSDQELLISQMELSFMSEVYVARQTAYGYEFWELYRPSRNERTRVVYYGEWNNEAGLKITQMTIAERRRDFGGALLRHAVLGTGQYDSTEDKKRAKLLETVWKLLEKELNFTTEVILVTDNSTEHKFPNNSQKILIQMLAKNEADVPMFGLLPDLSSLSIVDYSRPVAQSRYRIHMKRVGVDYNMWLHFLHPLPCEAWFIGLLIMVVFPVIILSMYRICRTAGFTGKPSSIWDLYITVHQMLCQQGGELQQELCSVSLLYVFINLWIFLFYTIYAAALASHLAIEYHNTPIYTLNELLKNTEYGFGVRRNSSEFDHYYKTNNAFLDKLNKAVMEQNVSNLPSTHLEGLQRVCSENKYAFMASSVRVSEFHLQIPCKLYYLRDEEYIVNAAYIMSKRNEYLPFINRRLQMFREVGVLSKLNADIVGREQLTLENPQSLESLEFQDTVFLQLLLVLGVVASVLMLFAELVYSKTKRSRRVDFFSFYVPNARLFEINKYYTNDVFD